jgi:hypothetical protein
MLCQAKVYVNLSGEPAQREVKVKDAEGKEWDMRVLSAFHIWFVKGEDTKNGDVILISKEELMTDSGVPMEFC